MINISKLSKRYSVRILEEADIEMLVEICKQNTVFYEYTEARPTKENILPVFDKVLDTLSGIAGEISVGHGGLFSGQGLLISEILIP